MPDILEKTRLPFNQLGVSSGKEIEELFRQLLEQANQDAKSIADSEGLEEFRVKWLGRNQGICQRVGDHWLKTAPQEMKKWVGSNLNHFKDSVEAILGYQKTSIQTLELDQPSVDLTLPGIKQTLGTLHPIRQTMDELERIFLSIGFSVVEGPEIETPYYNFEALNIPEHHPARDTMDTFYLDLPPGSQPHLLRTHTSPMQVHTMEKQQPPVRIIVPGKVYRRDNPDATHSYMFHQVEGLAVDADITF